MGVQPVITTVLPTFQRAPLLARAVRSVLDQSFRDFEVHIYDNASGDETSCVARRLTASDRRVKYHCHQTNIGPMKNFKYGLERVATPYFNILSDDDYLLPNFFATALKALRSRPDAMFFAGRLAHVDQHGRLVAAPLEGWKPGCYSPPAAALRWISQGDTWTSLLFRRESLLMAGGIDIGVGLEADFDFLLRIMLKAPLLVGNELCACFTIHDGSAMSRGSLDEIIAGMRLIEKKLAQRTDIAPELVRRLGGELASSNARRLFRLSLKLARRGGRDELQAAIAALRTTYRHPLRSRILELASSRRLEGILIRGVFAPAYDLRRKVRRLRIGSQFVLDGLSDKRSIAQGDSSIDYTRSAGPLA
jgi:glycosyltransferase involved in cell wall biosynthesis